MKQARTLTDKQLKAVYAHCATRRHAARDRAIVAVSFMAGLRAKEIAALTIENIVDEKGQMRDEFVLTKEQTKGRKARRVFVSQKLKKIFESYLKVAKLRKGCNALFQSQKGSCFSPNTMCQLFLNIYEEAGIDGASSHSGRRNLLTSLSQKGVSVRVLAEIAGHSSIAITQRYLDVNDEQMRAAVELI
jgi:integrase/recombinase XerD